jgi:hypothetical protein
MAENCKKFLARQTYLGMINWVTLRDFAAPFRGDIFVVSEPNSSSEAPSGAAYSGVISHFNQNMPLLTELCV